MTLSTVPYSSLIPGDCDQLLANFRVVCAAICAALGPQSSPLLYFLVWGRRNMGSRQSQLSFQALVWPVALTGRNDRGIV